MNELCCTGNKNLQEGMFFAEERNSMVERDLLQMITKEVLYDRKRKEKKQQGNQPSGHREFKSRIFAMLYSDPEKALELYNAVNNTNYDNPELLEINTLDNAIYMSMHNDVSFVFDARLSLYEHQSTFNPNLPLRYLLDVADLYSGMTRGKNLYGRKMIKLPEPRFLIFYNGRERQPERKTLKLSELYFVKTESPALELEALMLNINAGYNKELMDVCGSLRDYAEYTDRVRKYAGEMPLETAVEKAIDECIREGILGEFLEKNRAEAISVSIYEYDEEAHIRMEKEESRQEGIEEGRQEALLKGTELLMETYQEFGKSTDEIVAKLKEKFHISEEEAVKCLEQCRRSV